MGTPRSMASLVTVPVEMAVSCASCAQVSVVADVRTRRQPLEAVVDERGGNAFGVAGPQDFFLVGVEGQISVLFGSPCDRTLVAIAGTALYIPVHPSTMYAINVP